MTDPARLDFRAAILHTSSNAPMMLFVATEAVGAVILPHMAVVLASMYLSVAFLPWLRSEGAATPDVKPHANTSA